MTATYRVNGKVRFEGVASPDMRGKKVKIYDTWSDALVATTAVRRDGTWWANSTTEDRRFTWLTKFVAESGTAQSRWRRLGQAVAIRGRKPVTTRLRAGKRSSRTKVQVKVSGDSKEDRLIIGIQTGCSRHAVRDRFELKTNHQGVATINLPRPDPGDPYAIYRVRTENGLKISPPIVVKPSVQG